MAKTTKTMRITLTEDFLVPTDDGNIIFEPGDEIEVEYEDDELDVVETPEVIEAPIEAPAEELAAVVDNSDPIDTGAPADPLSFEGNPEVQADPEEDEVYIEDPLTAEYV